MLEFRHITMQIGCASGAVLRLNTQVFAMVYQITFGENRAFLGHRTSTLSAVQDEDVPRPVNRFDDLGVLCFVAQLRSQA